MPPYKHGQPQSRDYYDHRFPCLAERLGLHCKTCNANFKLVFPNKPLLRTERTRKDLHSFLVLLCKTSTTLSKSVTQQLTTVQGISVGLAPLEDASRRRTIFFLPRAFPLLKGEPGRLGLLLYIRKACRRWHGTCIFHLEALALSRIGTHFSQRNQPLTGNSPKDISKAISKGYMKGDQLGIRIGLTA